MLLGSISQNILKRVDGLLSELLVVRGVSTRDILLRIRGGQIQARVEQARIKATASLKCMMAGWNCALR